MLYVEDGVISITQNDDVTLEVNLETAAGEDYVLDAEDTLTLSVREYPSKDSPLLLSVTSAPGSNMIVLHGADTVNIAPGMYSYDVQINFADGTRYTVLPDNLTSGIRATAKNWKNFCMMGEVTIP